MGVLNNYEATNPFISSTTDAFNRLKPGFEAPVCIVTSLGHKPEQPSRNRSILIGLIRDLGIPRRPDLNFVRQIPLQIPIWLFPACT